MMSPVRLAIVMAGAAVMIAALLLTWTARAEPAPPGAASLCAPVADILAAFKHRLGEDEVFRGTAPNGRFALLLRSPAGAWSLFFVNEGVACLVAAGKTSDFGKEA